MTFRREVIGPCELILADCREVLGSLGRVDACVTDPPYGINYTRDSVKSYGFAAIRKSANKHLGGKRQTPIIGDDEPFDPTHLMSIGRKQILWGASAYAGKLPSNYGWLIWDKQIIGEWSGGDGESAWTNFANSHRIFRHRWQGMIRDGEECPVLGGDRRLVHPTQKPIALMVWCVKKTEGVVLDPYMGSGTTGVACVKLGRRFIGIEIEPKYFDIACRRISEAVRQPDLFVKTLEAKPVQEVLPL